MNTCTPQPGISTQDYQDTMQSVAAAYLMRHRLEHLDDGQLFERACHHLVLANGVPVFMAQRLVHLAMSALPPP